ncbi:hypothetical protein [Vreelandella sp. TE19]
MKHFPPAKLWLYGAIAFGFVMLESPLILVANRIEPTVLGIPFFLAWNLFWWLMLTLTFLVAYFTNWGSATPARRGHHPADQGEK